MNPSVEVLPPEEETPGQAVLVPPIPALPKEKKPPRETERIKTMFAFYVALGKDRTLAQVADHFGVKLAVVQKYSAIFEWKGKIAQLTNRSKADCFKDKVSDLLLLLLDGLTKPGKDTGTTELTSSAKTTAETIKLCVSSFKELRQDAREGEPGEANSNGRGKAGPTTLVQVIFKGLSE